MANEVANTGEEQAGSSFDISSLSGIEKAAILLLSLSEQDAASIIRHLEPKQVQRVGSAMTSMTDLNSDKVAAVHRAFFGRNPKIHIDWHGE